MLVLGLFALGGGFAIGIPARRSITARRRASAAAADGSRPAHERDIVIGIDAQQVFRSALWKRFESQIMARLAQGVEDYRAACGYDPFEALRGVTLGAQMVGGQFEGVIVVRGPDRDKTTACVGRALASRAKVTISGGIITIPGGVGPGDPPVVMAFADASTLVMATSRAKLDDALASGAPLRQSRAFLRAVALVDPKQSVWAIVNGGRRVRQPVLARHPAAGDARLGRAGRRHVDERAPAPRQRARRRAARSTAQAQLAMAQGMVEKIEVAAEGPDVKLHVAMTMPQIDALTGWCSDVGRGIPSADLSPDPLRYLITNASTASRRSGRVGDPHRERVRAARQVRGSSIRRSSDASSNSPRRRAPSCHGPSSMENAISAIVLIASAARAWARG